MLWLVVAGGPLAGFVPGRAAAAPVTPVADVPMRYVQYAALVDHVRINGKGDYTFLIDTGSTACTVTPQVAEQLHLAKGGWSNVAAIGATRKLRLAKVRTLSIGDARVDAPLTLIADDNGLSQHVGCPVNGVLGTPFLWKWPVQLDYPGQRFRVFPHEYDLRTQPVEAPWSGVTPLEMRGRAAFIQVALNGAKPHRMMLDTGATHVVVDEPLAIEAKARLAHWKSTSVGAFGPRRDSLYWLLDRIRVAGLTVENAQAFTPQALGDWRSDQFGNDAMDQFRVTIDAARRVMRFERDQMPERFADSPWGAGLSVRRDADAIRVAEVWPDGEAAAKGIMPGDEVVTVNEHDAAQVTDASLHDLLNQPPGYTVNLEVKPPAGAIRTVELRTQRYLRKRPAESTDAIASSLSVVQPPVSNRTH